MWLEKIRAHKIRAVLVLVVLAQSYWILFGWTLPTGGDLKFDAVEVRQVSSGGGRDVLEYSAKVINTGSADVPSRFYRISMTIDGQKSKVDSGPGRLRNNGSSNTYGGSREVPALGVPGHSVTFTIQANDRDRSNNSVTIWVPRP